MQLNKSSKKTKQTAEKTPVASAPEKSVAAAAEVKPKPRALKSSTPKKSEDAVTASPSHHHKVNSPPASEVRVAESKVAKPEPVLTVTETVTETITQPVATVATHDDIARLAHSLWAARGYTHGSPQEDWIQAEQQLLKKR